MDRDKLREAIEFIKRVRAGYSFDSEARFTMVIEAAESTLPKTKMVEVWIVHFAVKRHEEGQWEADCMPMTEGEAETRKEAAGMERDPMYACIRVTGPHQQEVPA